MTPTHTDRDVCGNPIDTTTHEDLGAGRESWICGCDPRRESPVDRALREAYERDTYWGYPMIPDPVDITSFELSAKKLAYTVPVPSELLADQGDSGHDGGTPRRKVRPTIRERWYNLRVTVGSWILPFDPYED